VTLSIPSPAQSVWFVGWFPIRAYAMCILAGIIVAVWITQRRLAGRGGKPGQALDVAVWAVPFGIVGGRLYHVLSSPQAYFGQGGHPFDAVKIWEGGLGIWGAVALGSVGAWIGCRRHGVSFLHFADAAAPGVALAQAIGRWGNYFNQELFGKPTTLPWALEIAPAHRPIGYAQFTTFQPTFLYESLACLAIFGILLLVEHRSRLKLGQTFAFYVVLYTFARFWFENMRIDPAHEIAGMRLNAWVSIGVFLAGVVWFVWLGRHEEPQRHPDGPRPDPATAVVGAEDVS